MARIRLQAFPAQFTPTPFQNLAYMAEKRAARQDAIDESIGKTKGLFASLIAAPGHENLATKLTSDYNKRVDDWYEKYKNSLTSREASRELTSLGTQFVNDQKVQTVVKSREFYEKFEPKLWEELNKKSYIDAPEILNPDGSFNQNSQMYDMSKFHVTSQADWNSPIQRQLAIKHAEIAKKHNVQPTVNPTTGEITYTTTTETENEWKDPNTFKDVVDSIEYQIMDSPVTDPGYLYLKETAKREHPGDEKAQREYVRDRIKNASTPFFYNIESTKTTIQEAKDSKDRDSSKTSDIAALGVLTTVSLKNLEDPTTGQPITSAQGLETAIKTLDAGITTIKGGIIKQFPAIAELEKAGGKPFYTDTELGFEVIDINKVAEKAGIKDDPIAMAQLNEKNIELVNAQVRKNGYYEKQAELMEAAGFNPNEDLYKQLPANLKTQVLNKSLTEIKLDPRLIQYFGEDTIPDPNWIAAHPYSPGYKAPKIKNPYYNKADNTSLVTGKPLNSAENISEHIIQMEELKFKNHPTMGGFTKERQQELLNNIALLFNNNEELIFKQDPAYKTYADLVEADLSKVTYQQAFNYQLSGEAYNTLKNAAILAASQGTFDRAKWDEGNPRFQDMGDDGEKAKEQILPQNVSGNKNLKNLWNDAKYSIRYDNDDNRWVVDAVTSKGVFEIPDVDGIAGMAEKIDPTLSNQYLGQQQNFFSQMEASNGRYAAISSPNPVANTNDYVIVKATTENHGDIKQGSYVFMLPEFKDKVFEVPTFYDFNKFMEYYNSQKGLPAEKMAQTLASRKGSTSIKATSINFNTYDSKYSGIGSKYFPTSASKGYSVKK